MAFKAPVAVAVGAGFKREIASLCENAEFPQGMADRDARWEL